MKTTLEIPDAVFRKAKVHAAANGISFREFVTEALQDKLRKTRSSGAQGEPEWMRLAGAFGKSESQVRETRRIQKAIDSEFEVIEEEI